MTNEEISTNARLIELSTAVETARNEVEEASIQLIQAKIAANKTETISETELSGATEASTFAKTKEAVASLRAALSGDAVVASNVAQTSSFVALTDSIIASTVAMLEFLLTNPVGWAILAAGAIFGAVKAYDALTMSVEELEEAASKAHKEIDDLNNSLNSHKQTVEKCAEKYNELSKGVDTFTNANKDLTDEQYKEYLSTVNELADTFPTLIKSYDDQGNAILNLGNDTDSVNKKLQELIENEQQIVDSKVAENLPTLFGDVIAKTSKLDDATENVDKLKSSVEGLNDAIQSSDVNSIFSNYTLGDSDVDRQTYNALVKGVKSYVESLNQLGDTSLNDILSYENIFGTEDGSVFMGGLSSALNTKQQLELANSISKEFNNIKTEIQDSSGSIRLALSDAQAEFDASWVNFRQSLTATMHSKASYQSLSDNSKELANALVGNLPSEISKQMDDKDPYAYIRENIVAKLSDMSEEDVSKISEAYNNLLSFNSQDVSYEQAREFYNKNIEIIKNAFGNGETDEELKLKFGIDADIDTVDKSVDKIKNILSDEFEDKISSLSLSDIEIASNFEVPSGVLISWDELIEKIEEAKKTAESFPSLDEARKSVSSLEEEYQVLQEIIKDTSDVSEENYTKLVGYSKKYASALRMENGRLTVSKTKLLAVAKSRQKNYKATLKQITAQKKLEYLKRAKELKIYDNQLIDTTSDTWDNINAVETQVSEYQLLTTQLDLATSAFERFKAAQETDDKPLFDTSQDAYKTIKEGLESGEVGHDDFKYAQQLLMGSKEYKEFLELGNAEQDAMEKQYLYMEQWAKNNEKFFGEDNKQNVINFLEELDKTGLLEDGKIASSEEIGKEFGWSIDAVNSSVQNANLYGFKDIVQQSPIDYIDEYTETVGRLKEAKEALQEANESEESDNFTADLAQNVKEAQTSYDEFFQKIPTKYAEMKQKFVDSGTNDSFEDWLVGDMGEENAQAFLLSVNDGLSQIQDKQQKIVDTIPEQYQGDALSGLQEQADLYSQIQTELLQSGNTFVSKNTQEYSSLVSEYNNLQKSLEKAGTNGNYLELNDIQSQIAAVKEQLSSLEQPTLIELQLDKSSIDAQISQVDEQINRLGKMASEQGEKGNYSAQLAIESARRSAQTQKSNLETEAETIEATIKYITDTSEVDTAKASIAEPTNTDVNITVNGVGELQTAKGLIDGLSDKTVTVSVAVKGSGSLSNIFNLGKGSAAEEPVKADGTFHAYAGGTDVSIKKNETALVNELGNEGVVRDGKLYEITGGAQFMDLKRGDIIFNHKQMLDLKKHGYTTSRGKMISGAHAEGTLGKAISPAYAIKGTANVNNKYNQPYIINGADAIRQNKALDKAQDKLKEIGDGIADEEEEAEEATEELFDWIERRLSMLSRNVERFFKEMQDGITKLSIDTNYKTSKKIYEQLLADESAGIARYNSFAYEKSGFDVNNEYAKLVARGAIDIETITDETLAKQINDYKEWYDKAMETFSQFEQDVEKYFNLPLDKASTKIEKFNKNIDLLGKKLDNSAFYNGTKPLYKTQNNFLKQELKENDQILKARKKAFTEANKNISYAEKQVNSVLKTQQLEENERKAFKTALKKRTEIDLSIFQEGSKAQQAAKMFNESLKASAKANDEYQTAIQENMSKMVEIYKQMFDNVKTFYDRQITFKDYETGAYDRAISETEAIGQNAFISYYKSQNNLTSDEIKIKEEERKKLLERLNSIQYGTDQWYDAVNDLNDIDESISTYRKNIAKNNNLIVEAYEKLHQAINNHLDRIISENSFYSTLLDHEKTASDKTGTYTEAGIAKVALAAANLEISKQKASYNQSELDRLIALRDTKDINKLLEAGYNSFDELNDDIEKHYDTGRENNQEIYNQEKELNSLVKERYDAELAYTQKLISDQKEALSLEKDLHDYRKNIEQKTTDINTLQMRLAALSGDTSEAGMARRQQLQKQLKEAKDDLADTEYDRFISDQQNMLDKLSEEYSDSIEEYTEQFMVIVKEGQKTANDNAEMINSTIQGELEELGIKYTSENQNLQNQFATSNIAANVQAIADKIITEDTSKSGINGGSDVKSNAAETAKRKEEEDRLNKENVRANLSTKSSQLAEGQINKDYNKSIYLDAKDELDSLEKTLADAKKAKASQKTIDKLTKQRDDAKSRMNYYQLSYEDQASKNKALAKSIADEFINTFAVLDSRKREDIKPLNQKIYDSYGNRTVPKELMPELASLLNVKWDGSFKETGNLYKYLHKIGFAGFSHGGIVAGIKKNGDDGLAALKIGESVLTPIQTQAFLKLADNLDALNIGADALKYFSSIPDIRNAGNNVEYGEVNFNFEMPNVTDSKSMIAALQNDKNLQKAIQSVSIDRINGGGRLSVNKF